MLVPPNGKAKTVKEEIIQILSREWPLSAKKLYNEIKKHKSVSYQAIHKSLKQLLKEDVVERDDKKYKLKMQWIKNVKQYAGKLEKTYNTEKLISDFQSEDKVFMFKERKNIVEQLPEIASKAKKDDILFGHNKSNLDYPKKFYKELETSIKRGVKIHFIIPETVNMKKFGNFLLSFNTEKVNVRSSNEDYLLRVFGIVDKEVMFALPFKQSMVSIHIKDSSLTDYIYKSFLKYWNKAKQWEL